MIYQSKYYADSLLLSIVLLCYKVRWTFSAGFFEYFRKDKLVVVADKQRCFGNGIAVRKQFFCVIHF